MGHGFLDVWDTGGETLAKKGKVIFLEEEGSEEGGGEYLV